MKQMIITALFAIAVSALTLVVERATATPLQVGSTVHLACQSDGSMSLSITPLPHP